MNPSEWLQDDNLIGVMIIGVLWLVRELIALWMRRADGNKANPVLEKLNEVIAENERCYRLMSELLEGLGERLEVLEKMTAWLKEVHSAKDSEGRPLWYESRGRMDNLIAQVDGIDKTLQALAANVVRLMDRMDERQRQIMQRMVEEMTHRE